MCKTIRNAPDIQKTFGIWHFFTIRPDSRISVVSAIYPVEIWYWSSLMQKFILFSWISCTIHLSFLFFFSHWKDKKKLISLLFLCCCFLKPSDRISGKISGRIIALPNIEKNVTPDIRYLIVSKLPRPNHYKLLVLRKQYKSY